MSPASGLGLALARLAASITMQLALAPPLPQLQLRNVYPQHSDSALSRALQDYAVAVPALLWLDSPTMMADCPTGPGSPLISTALVHSSPILKGAPLFAPLVAAPLVTAPLVAEAWAPRRAPLWAPLRAPLWAPHWAPLWTPLRALPRALPRHYQGHYQGHYLGHFQLRCQGRSQGRSQERSRGRRFTDVTTSTRSAIESGDNCCISCNIVSRARAAARLWPLLLADPELATPLLEDCGRFKSQ